MTELSAAGTGSPPRIGEGPGQQRLRHAHARRDIRAIAKTSFHAIENEAADQLLAPIRRSIQGNKNAAPAPLSEPRH